MHFRVMLSAVILAPVLAGCTFSPASVPDAGNAVGDVELPPSQARVELMLFSGRPNPSWLLTETETHTLSGLLKGLAPIEQAPLHEGLGYSGFAVTLREAGSSSPASVRIHDGLIIYSTDDRSVYFGDAERRIERWLVQTARPHVAFDLYMAIPPAVRE